ncbi:MAG: hypothetical protein JNM72_14395 [Deltaproteobacteria bacterium]|nr:hypothetical protein [Deltaproteobacteria bacterium]
MRLSLSPAVLLLLLSIPTLGGCAGDPKPEPGDDGGDGADGADGVDGADGADGTDTDDTGAPPTEWAAVGQAPLGAFMSVHGRAADDVYVVGANDGLGGGQIWRYDGAAWARLPNTDPNDLWWVHAMADGTTFAVGAGGTILRDEGAGFVRMRTPGIAQDTLYGVWGAAPDDVWAVGGFAGRWGFLWHFDGTAWSAVPLPDDMPVTAEGELPGLFKVWGTAADDVWAVGTHGTALHYDGAAWSVVPTGTEELLFTVHAAGDQVLIVGPATVLEGGVDGLVNVTPTGAGILQGACVDGDGTAIVTGQSGTVWSRAPGADWELDLNATGLSPESLHAAWIDPEGGRWAAGGGVLSGGLLDGVVQYRGPRAVAALVPGTLPAPTDPVCPTADIDPGGFDASMARRWNELILDTIRRDIPRPGVHARNLHHLSLAMWDAWATFDELADPVLSTERLVIADEADRRAAQETAIAYAAYTLLKHRYASQVGGPTSVACYDASMEAMGFDPTREDVDGDDPVAVGNRIGRLIIDHYADDGANEAANYADITGWAPLNPPLVVDRPGVEVDDPNEWQILNLAAAETQNGIVLDSGLQGYIGSNWGLVEPWALDERVSDYLYIDPGTHPVVEDPEMAEWVLDVLRKHSKLDPTLPETIDISPGAYGNNPLGTNDGAGHPVNGVTGEPYAPNVVKLGDFARVLAEFWADGPKSETPPGHWNTLANFATDLHADAGDELRVGGDGPALDRLAWDVSMYLSLNGALHDAAVVAWGIKREFLGPRPITLIRWMGQQGQRSNSSLPSYHPDGLLLEDGVVEVITEESAAPGERHHHLRWFIGEIAVRSWRGEPGDRANETTGVVWMRAKEWFPYQRRTFVSPAFPGFTSGHSTFSRAAAETLTLLFGSPWFNGGMATYDANANAYLIFEDGPSESIQLQWGTFQDAADQAGQSRLWGGIHIWPDDSHGRQTGYQVGHLAFEHALPYYEGTARVE